MNGKVNGRASFRGGGQCFQAIPHFKTEQEVFWHGVFGDDYIERNSYEKLLPDYVAKWALWLTKTGNINSCLEFGANIGINLKAVQTLMPQCELSVIEINHKACEEYLSKFIKKENIFEGSILDYNVNKKYDLTFVNGVLIHINPDELQDVYAKLYESSSKYIIIAEYFSPTPVMVEYRGNTERLFKRDFAGEMMDKYPDLELLDYGFLYKRAKSFPHDNFNWFILKKS